MSISSVTSKVVYVGTGSTAAAARVFAYPFKILAATDLTVSEYNNTTSAATTKTLSTHYDVSGVGSSGGGNVTITGSYTNLPTGCQLVIQRIMDLTQETDYVENDAFSAETHETALDKLTMISQQLQEQLDRAVLADITQTSPDLDVIANANAAKSSAVVAAAQAVLSSAYAGATTTANPTFTGTANFTTLKATLLSSTVVTTGTISSNTATINNAATTYALQIEQATASANEQYGVYVHSNAVQTSSSLVRITQDNPSSNTYALQVVNDGSGTGLQVLQSGGLGANNYGLYVYSDAVQTSSNLVLVTQDNSTSSSGALYIKNEGVGDVIHIEQNGNLAANRFALFIDQKGTTTNGTPIRFDGVTVSNGTAGLSLTSTAPAGITTPTVSCWLPIECNGILYYIPCWT